MLILGKWDNSSCYHSDISWLYYKLITLVVIATGSGLPVFLVCIATFLSSGAYSTRLEKLLKYQLGTWGVTREFYSPSHQGLPTLIQTTSVTRV